MLINVTLHGILRDYLPRQAKGQTTLDLPTGATIEEVIQQLKIKQTVTAAVDGVQVELSHQLQAGEGLHLFRVVGGGV